MRAARQFLNKRDLTFSPAFEYQHVGVQNASENTRKLPHVTSTRAQHEKYFLYYTMHWVKMRTVCGSFSRFGTLRFGNAGLPRGDLF